MQEAREQFVEEHGRNFIWDEEISPHFTPLQFAENNDWDIEAIKEAAYDWRSDDLEDDFYASFDTWNMASYGALEEMIFSAPDQRVIIYADGDVKVVNADEKIEQDVPSIELMPIGFDAFVEEYPEIFDDDSFFVGEDDLYYFRDTGELLGDRRNVVRYLLETEHLSRAISDLYNVIVDEVRSLDPQDFNFDPHAHLAESMLEVIQGSLLQSLGDLYVHCEMSPFDWPYSAFFERLMQTAIFHSLSFDDIRKAASKAASKMYEQLTPTEKNAVPHMRGHISNQNVPMIVEDFLFALRLSDVDAEQFLWVYLDAILEEAL